MDVVIGTLSKVHGHKVSPAAAGQSQNAILILVSSKMHTAAAHKHTQDTIFYI